ncbi:predicted protein [Plenodomus lingam JN3]|uniref:Predicted protein n=1 Tax=Leptosphaeria maculans (strain JN3 / isolate v23.1.3 / race Av1-4-5-6-7-8) TaxID=985895 RepID=E4ZYV9_LEPMJ|nr:predicted protein [Plenodomus lingam JN3]CBX96635.1 predicted protein [Plenodomus lingam JN3]
MCVHSTDETMARKKAGFPLGEAGSLADMAQSRLHVMVGVYDDMANMAKELAAN